MAKSNLPSPEALRQLLRYDPETGKLFWLPRGPEWFRDGKQTSLHNANIWNARLSGKEALAAKSGDGYLCGRVFNAYHRAHRVIYAMAYGLWPKDQIDHIDGNKVNNRLENLRDVTNKENGRNAKRPITNTSGVTGVAWLKREKKWLAYIRADDVRHSIGYFGEFDAAVTARKAAEEKYGFHANHGRST